LSESVHEGGVRGERARVQFGISAGQVDRVGRLVWRLAGERRERDDLSPRRAPAEQRRRIAES